MYITFYLYRFGYVEFESVAKAQNMFNKEENIELDGHTLFIDFATTGANVALDKWEELDESSKILHVKLKLVEHCIRNNGMLQVCYLCLSGFYEGVRPQMKQSSTDEEQESVDNANTVIAKNEDAEQQN